MCEGIARAGNGLCLMATTTESIIGKCTKLMRASRTYILKNVSIDWGVQTDLIQAGSTTELDPGGTMRQSPSHIPAIYPGSRFVAFALIDDPAFTPPKEVIIRGQRDGVGELLQFRVPLQHALLPPGRANAARSLIATLAAHRAITEIEDAGGRADAPADVKDLVVRLGTTYQLASKYTSFVAVDTRTQRHIPQPAPAPPAAEHDDYDSDDDEMGFGLFDDGYVRPAAPPPADPETIEERVYALVRLQAFDGSFPATAVLEKLVGQGALAKTQEHHFPEAVWATVLAVVFLKSHMQDERELLDGLVDKAMEYVTQVPSIDLNAIFDVAEGFLN